MESSSNGTRANGLISSTKPQGGSSSVASLYTTASNSDNKEVAPSRSKFTASIFKESISKLYPGSTGPKITDEVEEQENTNGNRNSRLGVDTAGDIDATNEGVIELRDLPNLG